ncbi:hypothetical protein JL720_5077 [Aureococcus anophagefferens]|nr:hypothetical protein JL720_5077 [Aureococcus anophagefferens]
MTQSATDLAQDPRGPRRPAGRRTQVASYRRGAVAEEMANAQGVSAALALQDYGSADATAQMKAQFAADVGKHAGVAGDRAVHVQAERAGSLVLDVFIETDDEHTVATSLSEPSFVQLLEFSWGAVSVSNVELHRPGEASVAYAAAGDATVDSMFTEATLGEREAKAAQKEIEEFTNEFLNAARQCFSMIDKDNSGTLTKAEIVKAVAEDKEVVKFLQNCGEENLQFLLRPARLEKALEVLDTSKDGEVDADEWETAVNRGLERASRSFEDERAAQPRGAQRGQRSGSLDKGEVVRAVKTDKKVISFLVNCGNENLQYLLVPERLEHALQVLDTDRDGEINAPEWEGAIETALANKLEARAQKRVEQAKAARKEIEEFTNEFVNAARKCFQMIDKDNSGTLTKTEIVKAVAEDRAGRRARRRDRAAAAEDEAFSTEFLSMARQVFDMIDVDGSGSLDKAEVVKAVKGDQKVIKFLVNCGNPNLQYLLVPARLEHALAVLDTDRDGEISGTARGAVKAARKEIEEFTNEFVSAARKCFEMIDKDSSGTLTKAEIVKAIAEDKAVVDFLKKAARRCQFLLRPARLEKALEVLDTSNDGELDANEWEGASAASRSASTI